MDNNIVELSVIIPIFNTEKHLSDCLNSLRKQTFTNWEAILVDDGSTDNSKEIIDGFVSIDSRFKTVHLSNHGVSYARNCGIELSRGAFIAFLDSDDIFDENMFLNQMRSINASGSDVVQCNFLDLLPNGNIVEHGSKSEYVISGTESVLKECFAGFLNSSVCTKVYRKDVISGIRFDESVSVGEDMLFNIEVCSRANQILITNKNSYYYVIHNESAMHKTVGKKRFDVLAVFDLLKTRFSNSFVGLNYILIGEIKELITIINLLIDQKGKKKKIFELRKVLISDYNSLSKKDLLTKRNRFICRLIKYMPHFYLFLAAIKLRKKRKHICDYSHVLNQQAS